MQLFILDEAAASRWLNLVVAAHDGDETAMAQLGGDYPGIGRDWEPRQVGEEPEVWGLVHAAQEAEIFARPEGMELAFEYVADTDGGYYRWLVTLEEPGLTLASWTEEMRRIGEFDTVGVEAALSVLQEAVRSGNATLESLTQYTAVQVSELALMS